MSEMVMQVIWYLVIGASVLFFTVLDGFDLGVGALHPFAKNDEERRVFLNAIGPVWDGNEVWLIVIFGAMFAGFPEAYATIGSAFYTLFMIFIAGIIFRAVAIEFRSKLESPRWRSIWDWAFSISSYVILFGIGILLANLVKGIRLEYNFEFVGTFSDFFTPYTILVGITSIALFTMHGAIYLVMKTEDALHDRLRNWVKPCIGFFIACYLVMTVATFMTEPHMVAPFKMYPWLTVVPVLGALAIINVPLELRKGNDGRAFISSCLSIGFLLALFGIGTYPTLVRSSLSPNEYSINIFNASSSPATLKVLLTIAAIGVPLVLSYGIWLYRIFRGKVKLDSHSY